MQATVTPSGAERLRKLAWSLLEVPIAIGIAFAVCFTVFKLGRVWTHCVDISGLPWLLGGALAGIVAGIAYWIAALRRGTQWRARAVLDLAAIVIAIMGIAWPQFCWGSQCRPTSPPARVVPQVDGGNVAPVPRR